MYMIAKYAQLAAVSITLSVLLLGWSLSAYSQTPERSGANKAEPDIQRWYKPNQVSRGTSLYAKNCSVCHGKKGEGAPGWQGTALPPPLNGTGHTWHHPFGALGYQIKFGAPGGKGKMPGFASSLRDEDILNIIAWFQSQWPDEIYAAWVQRELESRQRKQ